MLYVQHFIEVFILPPGLLFSGVFLGVLLVYFSPKLAKVVVGLSLFFSYVVATPTIAQLLLNIASSPYHQAKEIQQTDAKAIVVLGGGRNRYAKEYGVLGSTSALETERLLYAAYLHRKFKLPLLLTSGDPWNVGSSEAVIMAQTLKNMGVQEIKWLEEKAATTYENAAFSHPILKDAGVTEALVVTHDWHMPRAMQVFDAEDGVAYYPAPVTMGFSTSDMGGRLLDYLPQARAMAVSNIALHELLGQLYYRLKYTKK